MGKCMQQECSDVVKGRLKFFDRIPVIVPAVKMLYLPIGRCRNTARDELVREESTVDDACSRQAVRCGHKCKLFPGLRGDLRGKIIGDAYNGLISCLLEGSRAENERA